MNLHPNLFPFQREGARWLASQGHAILADEMGVGKTAQAIAACDLIGAKNILVLCPGIARENWEREFQQWQLRLRTICLIRSSKDRADANVVISSYAGIQSRPILLQLVNRRWEVVICDEGHALKNKDALTTKIVYGHDCTASKGLAALADRVWLLSGTIICNGPHELWTHCRALFPHAARGLERYNAWFDRFCYWQPSEDGRRMVLAARNVDEFVERVRLHIKRRQQKDVLPDLPALRFASFTVEPTKLPPRSEPVIEAEQIVNAALARCKDNPGQDEMQALLSINMMHVATLLKWTGIAKAPAVAELINYELANGLEKVVVFARHTEVFSILEKAIPGSVSITGKLTSDKKRQEIIDAFQGRVPNKNPRVLLVHLDIASTALTLTAANNVVFAETGWVPKDVLQAAKRCHRIGQHRPVLARIMSLRGSADEIVSNAIARKHRIVSQIESHFVG